MKLIAIIILALAIFTAASILSRNPDRDLMERIERIEREIIGLKKTLKFHKQALVDMGKAYDKVIPVDGGFILVREKK